MMRSRFATLSCLIAACAVAFALPALAQKAPEGGEPPVTAPLRALLASLPAVVVQPAREAPDIAFGDIEAARGLPQAVLGNGSRAVDPALLPVLRALPNGRFTEDPALVSGGWAARVGFAPTDLRAVLTIDRAPLHMTVLRLDPAVAARVGPALAASGYASRADRPGAWAVGEDFAIDFAARAEGDPFRGMLGAASRVAVDGDLLRHASGWPAFDILRAPGPATADAAPTLAPLLAAMDGLDAGALIRAVILPNAAGLSLQDPMTVIRRGALPAPTVVWLSAVIADFARGERVDGGLDPGHPGAARSRDGGRHALGDGGQPWRNAGDDHHAGGTGRPAAPYRRQRGLSAVPECRLSVTSRKVVWLFLEQLRL